MKVDTQTYIVYELKDSIRSDIELALKMPEKGSDMYLPWPSKEFSSLMGYSKQYSLSVSCRFMPDQEESEQVEWYAMESNSSCTTNDKDEKWRKPYWNSMEFVPNTKYVRQFKEYRISKLRHYNNKIVSPGGTFFFFPVEVIEILRANFLTGMDFGKIYHLKSDEEYSDYKLLTPNSLVGPAINNSSMQYKTGDEEGEWKYYEYFIPHAGVRTFSRDVMSKALDFNLSVEPMSGYNVGSIIVSRRVKEVIEKEKIKGVFFEPVLIADTPLYKKFLEQWREFEAEIKGANLENKIN